jgi:hypothetical protein
VLAAIAETKPTCQCSDALVSVPTRAHMTIVWRHLIRLHRHRHHHHCYHHHQQKQQHLSIHHHNHHNRQGITRHLPPTTTIPPSTTPTINHHQQHYLTGDGHGELRVGRIVDGIVGHVGRECRRSVALCRRQRQERDGLSAARRLQNKVGRCCCQSPARRTQRWHGLPKNHCEKTRRARERPTTAWVNELMSASRDHTADPFETARVGCRDGCNAGPRR